MNKVITIALDKTSITASKFREKAEAADKNKVGAYSGYYLDAILTKCREKANLGYFEYSYTPRNIEAKNLIRGEAIEHALKTMEEELGFKVKIDWTCSYNERKVCVYQAHISW